MSAVKQHKFQPTLNYRTPVEHRAAHEDHSVSRDCRRRGVIDVVYLEDDLARGGHWDAVAVGERQSSVVVENRVEVLDPDRIDGPVEHQPDVISLRESIC